MTKTKGQITASRVSSQKLFFIQGALRKLALPNHRVLDTLLAKKCCDDHTQTVLMRDVMRVYQELSQTGSPGIALQIGRQISCGDYGLYGCTLLCKSTLEDTLNFSIKYHSLVTRTARLYLQPLDEDRTLYGCADILYQPDITQFNLELQIAINLTLMREVLGDANFAPRKIYYAFPRPDYGKMLEDYAKCDVCYNADVTGIELDSLHLRVSPSKSNPLAIPLLMRVCDEHKCDFAHQNHTVESVYTWVSQNIHNELKLEKIAEELCLSERTLRRKLAENGTSFSAICLNIKQGFAKKYIAETQLSCDDIAESLGFKETSNFRHAFKEWTGMTPTAYRKSKHQGSAHG